MNLWNRLEAVAEQRSVLRHAFYLRWSDGTLTGSELARYSGQYRHAVVALADAAAAAARSPEAGIDAPSLAAHADEERAHIELWDEFVAAVGGSIDAEASPETKACASIWAGGDSRPLLETLTAMYAIESTQPAISATKRDGLARHYGFGPVRYFDLHERLDDEHATHLRRLIDARLPGADEEALVGTVERVLDGNWLLLDGVDAAANRT